MTRVPLTVWHALRRMSAWIEPMLIAEWVRLTKGYAERQGMRVSTDAVMSALRGIEPERDTHFVRNLALAHLARGQPEQCAWSGRPLAAPLLDIDHCLPWSAWPCGDLWNLMPAAAAVNRRGKREKIVSATTLAEAKPLILDWWRDAYLESQPSVRARFAEEAQSTLPILTDRDPDLEDLFLAVDIRRLRLLQDTQLPEWRQSG